jgi:hypothetical protein
MRFANLNAHQHLRRVVRSKSGAQVNVILNSGSNELHGSGFELRNAVLDARNFFAPSTEPKPKTSAISLAVRWWSN